MPTAPFSAWALPKARTISISPQTVPVTYATTAPAPGTAVTATANAYRLKANMVSGHSLRRVQFSVGTDTVDMQPNGALSKNINPTTGVGVPAGTVTTASGEVLLQSWTAGASSTPTAVRMTQTPPAEGLTAPYMSDVVVFRTAAAPIRPGSISVQGNMADGTAFNVTAGVDGKFNGARVKGKVNYEAGLVELYFVNPANPNPDAAQVDLSGLQIAGVGTLPADLARTPGMRYNAVAYTYLPLDAFILGLDPVRLPQDGRVPVFKSGRVVVVHNTQKMAAATVANGQTVNTGRTRLSRLRVWGNDGLEITTGFAKDLDAGTVTFTNVAGMSQPVVVEHRIEDEALCAEAQITGDLRLTRPLTHEYPVPGTYVSSAMVVGTLQASAQDGFAQEAWTAEWSDTRIGNPVLAAYDQTVNPVSVTNAGAMTERWAIIFTSNTDFYLAGEAVGQIITGNTATTLAPVNPATGEAYFTLQPAGWGSGWVAGNVYRFNTAGANFPLWVARTVLQSPSAPPGTDQTTISILGDIDQ